MKLATTGLAAAVLLAGCTIERTVIEQPTTTSAAPTTTTEAPRSGYRIPETASAEDEFIAIIVQVYGPLPVSRYEVIETGWITCDGLDAGVTQTEVEQMILESATTEDSVLFLTAVFGAAVLYLCPEYAWMLDKY